MNLFDRKITFTYLLLALLLIPGCAPSIKTVNDADLAQQYRQAIEDARIAEPEEISRSLVAIADYNSDLVWSEREGQRFVRVVTWTSWNGYDDKVGQSMTASREIWVTTVPELQRFCRHCGFSGNALTLRLEKLLGLPPHGGKTRFVEIWVSPDDLFRPSPDPEISDSQAELNFPISGKFVLIQPEYRKWYNNLKADSYGGDGYPWTRLGYTYDWGNPRSEIGLSEFVIRQGAAIEIHSVNDTEGYCR